MVTHPGFCRSCDGEVGVTTKQREGVASQFLVLLLDIKTIAARELFSCSVSHHCRELQ